jgi:predicted branched-subunit amino acid permease
VVRDDRVRSPFRAVHRGDLRDALALVAAIAVVGASFGALAAAGGVPPLLIVGMSVLVFAGGAQFLVVAVVASGGSVVAAVAAGFLLNLRLLPFGLAVGETVGGGWLARLAGAQLVTDETVAFSRARPSGPRARAAFWMCGILLYTAWNVGTVAGMLAGSAVPDPAAFGVDAAFPAGLLALLLPGLRRRDARRVALTAAVVALLATRVLPTGLPVLAGLLGLLVAGTPPGAAQPPGPATRGPGGEQSSREPPAGEDEPPAASPGTGP